jgi:hypothetical protein
MFQDGIIAQAVDEVVSQGVAYFSSAGNNGDRAYSHSFNPSGLSITIGGNPAGEAHDFDPGPDADIEQSINVPINTTLYVSLQWDEPFFSLSGGTGSTNDLDIYLVAGNTVVASSTDDNLATGDPLELLVFTNNGSFASTTFSLLITRFSGENPQLLKYVPFGQGVTINEYETKSGTCFGHANAAGAAAVGAAFYQETPEFGVFPPIVQSYSSAGGVPILFDSMGNRLAEPEFRKKPLHVAPDGTNTTFFGTDVDSDGFPNFFGTSAAAPYAAAVATIMKEAVPPILPLTIYDILENTAFDMGPPGFDDFSGAGFIQADLAVASAIDIICVYDADYDGDVDGQDLAELAAGFGTEFDKTDLVSFAEEFGNDDCGPSDL